MPRSLSKLRLHNDETFCWNKSATSERFHGEDVKKAENELLAQFNLAKDSVLVESTKKQFSCSIARLQHHLFSKKSTVVY